MTDDGTKQGVRSLHPTYCDSAFYRHLYYDDNRGGSDDGSSSSREALDWLKLLRSARNTVDFSGKSAESVSSSACCLITTATQGVTLKLNLVNCKKVMQACVDLWTSRRKMLRNNYEWVHHGADSRSDTWMQTALWRIYCSDNWGFGSKCQTWFQVKKKIHPSGKNPSP